MTEAIVGKRQPGGGNSARIGVRDQRQNGMVERRSRNLDSPPSCCLSVRRQNLADQIALVFGHKFLILEGKSTPLANQFPSFGFLEKVFVVPGKLRKHLQIGEVLQLELPL